MTRWLPETDDQRPTVFCAITSQLYTVIVLRMVCRKWKETKRQPSMLPGPAVPGCSLVSFHILWAILSTSTVEHCYSKYTLIVSFLETCPARSFIQHLPPVSPFSILFINCKVTQHESRDAALSLSSHFLERGNVETD